MKNKLFSIKSLILLVFSVALFGAVLISTTNQPNKAYADGTAASVTWYKYDAGTDGTSFDTKDLLDKSKGTQFDSNTPLDILSGAVFVIDLYEGQPGVKLDCIISDGSQKCFYFVPLTDDGYFIDKIHIVSKDGQFEVKIDYTGGAPSGGYTMAGGAVTYRPDDDPYEPDPGKTKIIIKLEATASPIIYRSYVPYNEVMDNGSYVYKGVVMDYNYDDWTDLPDPANIPTGVEFENWLIHYTGPNASWDGVNYTVTLDVSNKLLKIKGPDTDYYGEFIFKVTDSITAQGENYLVVTQVKGKGVLQSKQTTTEPIVFPKWSLNYEVTLSAGASVWDTNGQYKDVEKPNDLVSADTKKTINKSTTDKFPDTRDKAFAKSGDVYNYGFTTKNYTIKLEYADVTEYLYYNGTDWAKGNISSVSTIVGLNDGGNSTTFGEFATFLNTKFVFSLTSMPTITITASWNQAVVTLKCGSATYDVDYNSSYDLNAAGGLLTQITPANGCAVCLTVDGDLASGKAIANSGIWNYVSITSYNHSSGKFELELTKNDLPNVWRVKLNFDPQDNFSTELLDASGLYYTSGVVSKALGDLPSKYTYENLEGAADRPSAYTFTNQLIDYGTDNHVQLLLAYYKGYTDQLQATFATAQAGLQVMRTVYNCGNDGRYIYLAHNIQYGDLPLFKSGRYTTIGYSNKETGTSDYAFITTKYKADNEAMAKVLREATTPNGQNNSDPAKTAEYGIWTYSTDNVVLRPVKYDRSLKLDLSIFDDNANADGYGYAHILIESLSNSNQKFYYTAWFDNTDPDNSRVRYFTKNNTYPALGDTDGEVAEVKLYLGHKITIIPLDEFGYEQDGSVVFEIGDETFNQMIGYKFKSGKVYLYTAGNTDILTITDNFTSDIAYEFKVNDTTDEPEFNGREIGTRDTLAIELVFEMMNYDILVQMEDHLSPYAISGTFDVIKNGADPVGSGTEATVSSMRVGDSYVITYYSHAGYQLQRDGVTVTLYNEGTGLLEPVTSIGFSGQGLDVNAPSKKATIPMNAEWLKKYLYLDPNNRSADVTSLEQVMIYTEAVELTLRYRWEDKNGTVQTQDIRTFKLPEYGQEQPGEIAGQINIGPIATTTTATYGKVFVDHSIQYAMFNSCLYNPNKTKLNDCDLYTTYTFPLTETLSDIILTSDRLGRMLATPDDTDVYINLTLRPIAKINVTLENDQYWANLSDHIQREKVVTARYDEDSTKWGTVTLKGNDVKDNMSIKDVASMSYVVYTYESYGTADPIDDQLLINSRFDTSIYVVESASSVGGVLSAGTDVEGGKQFDFNLNGTTNKEGTIPAYTLNIKWDYKVLDSKVSVWLENDEILDAVAKQAVIDAVQPKLTPDSGFKFGESYTILFNGLNDAEWQELINTAEIQAIVDAKAAADGKDIDLNDYRIFITVNNQRGELFNQDTITVDRNDYLVGTMEIKVYFVDINGGVHIHFMLDKTGEVLGTTAGTITYRGQELAGGGYFFIPDGQKFEVLVTIGQAYEYEGHVLYNNGGEGGQKSQIAINANKLTIRSSFSNDNDSGNYYIILSKVKYNINIVVVEDVCASANKSNYKALNIVNNKACEGDIIQLANVDIPAERLDYYDVQGEKLYYNTSGDPVEFTFTQDMINKIGADKTLTIYAHFRPKHKLVYNVVKQPVYGTPPAVTVVAVDADGNTYQSGEYTLSDKITLATTLNDASLQGKFALKYGETLKGFGDTYDVDISTGDKSLTITVSARDFAPVVEVYRMSSPLAVILGNGTQVVDITEVAEVSGVAYDQNAEVKFKNIAQFNDGEGNKDHKLVQITIDDQEYELDGTKITADGYTIDYSGDWVIVKYKVDKTIYIEADYNIMMAITPFGF